METPSSTEVEHVEEGTEWTGLLMVLTDNMSSTEVPGSNATEAMLDTTGTKEMAFITLALLLILAVVTNSLIIAVVHKAPKLHNVYFYLMASLALAHIISSAVIMPFAIAKAVLGTFPLSSVWCQVWQIALLLCVCSSLLHMCLAALHALLMLSFPMCYRKSTQLTKTMMQVSIAWIVPVLLAIPYIVMVSTEDVPVLASCSLVHDQATLAGLIPLFYIPLVLVIVVYLVTAIRMKQTGGMAVRLSSQKNNSAKGVLPPGLQKEPRIIVKDEESNVCNSETASLASGQEYEPYNVDTMVTMPLTNHLVVALQDIANGNGGAELTHKRDNTSCSSSGEDQGDTTSTGEETESNPESQHKEGQFDMENSTEEVMSDGHDHQDGSQENSSSGLPEQNDETSDKSMAMEPSGNVEHEDDSKRCKCGKEQLNGPVTSADIHIETDNASLISGSSQGEDNLAYQENSLADMIKVHHDPPADDQADSSHLDAPPGEELDSREASGSDTSQEMSGEAGDDKSQLSQSNSQEDHEDGRQPRRARSILRRDGSTRPSKKVKFDVPDSQTKENKAPRIKRRPTGYRRDNRKSNNLQINGNTVSSNHVITNGVHLPMANGKGHSAPLWVEKNGKLCPVGVEESLNTEYMVRVQNQYGVRLSHKVRNHRINMTLLTFILLFFSLLAAPYLLLATTYSVSSPEEFNVSQATITVLEWLLMATTTINFVLCIIFSSDFRSALGGLCIASKQS